MSLATTLLAPRRTVVAGPVAPSRDTAVDVARAACLVVVVLLHAMMVGVSNPGGTAVFENAMMSWEWFPAASWIVQVMPLFFVLGGFSAYTDWTKRRAAGVTGGAYLLSRVHRLALPAFGAIAATALFLAGMTLAGVDPAFIAEAGFRISQPLWFLGVYLLCTTLVPAAVAMHRRAPALTVAVLAAAVVGIDVARGTSGIEAIGLANLLFVWLLVQQLGFFLADGSVSALSRRSVAMLGAGALSLLGVTVLAGVYPADLYQALNPPTAALVLLGVAQLAIFELLRPGLRRLHGVGAVRSATRALGERSMTVYAWHMLVLIALAGALLLVPGELPVPLSPDWWDSRVLWLIVSGVAVAIVAQLVGGLERRGLERRPGSRSGSRRTEGILSFAVAAVTAGGVVTVLAVGASPAAWVVATALVAGGLLFARSVPAASGTLVRV